MWVEGLFSNLYGKLLWFLGFREGEYISDHLARQKERLGAWWWLFPIITILITIGLLGLEIWMVIHIIFWKPVDRFIRFIRRKV